MFCLHSVHFSENLMFLSEQTSLARWNQLIPLFRVSFFPGFFSPHKHLARCFFVRPFPACFRGSLPDCPASVLPIETWSGWKGVSSLAWSHCRRRRCCPSRRPRPHGPRCSGRRCGSWRGSACWWRTARDCFAAPGPRTHPNRLCVQRRWVPSTKVGTLLCVKPVRDVRAACSLEWHSPHDLLVSP